jgi:hypothetical protein
LKRGWTRFWLYASLLPAMAGLGSANARLEAQTAVRRRAHAVNEILLAGLRPGRDTLAAAEKRFKSKKLSVERDSRSVEWRDACSGRAIHVGLDRSAVIQSVTVTTLGLKQGPCGNEPAHFFLPENWMTGHGVKIGQPQDAVIATYGEPDSTGPSTKGGHELELLYYQFDWAGSDVPQVMEVFCARETGRVVEITLAYPSL